MTDPVPVRRRPRPILRAIGAVVSFYLLGFLLSALLLWPFAGRLTGGATATELAASPTPLFALVQGASLLLAFGAATWLVGVRALHLDARELRWRTRLGWGKALAVGLAFGILPAAVAMMMGVFAAGAGWTDDGGSFTQWLSQVTKTVLILGPAALAEELMFRGLPLVVAAAVLGRGRAIVVFSVVFALAHILNPDVTGAAIGNIALAGIFLSLAFYSSGGMWTAFGAHLGWNATLAALAAPVSGLPFDIPAIDYRTGSPVWLTGGAFGPEGGLLATLTLTATVVLVAQWVRRDAT
ncbi:MAG TPA: type II CAAX endopeptidase family protein [Gemmatimonadales bacterium]|nr:type II CAAX endopeptidase family protein [Gemmatimonadales bacterium]